MRKVGLYHTFGMLTYLVHGFMCIGIWEFHTGNMRVSVWSGQRVGTCSVHFFPFPFFFFYFYFFLMFPPFFLVVRVLPGQYIYTLRGLNELTQAWSIISVSVPKTTLHVMSINASP